VKRALDLRDELGDIVQRKPWPEITEVAGRDPEGLPLRCDALARQVRRDSALSLAATSSSRVSVVRMS
jgi:hypothetical protein